MTLEEMNLLRSVIRLLPIANMQGDYDCVPMIEDMVLSALGRRPKKLSQIAELCGGRDHGQISRALQQLAARRKATRMGLGLWSRGARRPGQKNERRRQTA